MNQMRSHKQEKSTQCHSPIQSLLQLFIYFQFALVIKPVGVDPTTAEILESPDHIDPLRSFANAVLQQVLYLFIE